MAEQQHWYYAEQGQQRGPVTVEELRRLISEGRVAGATLVWHEGMANWEQAGAIAELFDGQPPGPQPAPLPYGQSSIQYYNPAQATAYYAGFWLRFAAYIIDSLVMFVPGAIISGMSQFAMRMPRAGSPRSPLGPLVFVFSGNIASWIINWLYFALMESSPRQATLGKMACGLVVTDLNGNRITFGRATGRFFGKFLSTITFYIGFMMAGWTEKKQALHDMMAHTLVVRRVAQR